MCILWQILIYAQNTMKKEEKMKKRSSKRILALLMTLALCGSMLYGCGNSGDADQADQTQGTEQTEETGETGEATEPAADGTLVVTASGFENKFSPFFAQNADDMDVVDMVSLYMMYVDRVSNPILNGIEGETREYNGTPYTYTGPADITVNEQADGGVSYDIKMRDDLVFSDGTPIDIDDFIFSLYVYLDPAYDGSTTLYSTPILGLDDYLGGMDTLVNLLLAAGPDNTDFTYWDEDQQTNFWDELNNEAGPAFAQSIIDYCIANGYAEEGDEAGAAAAWGFEGANNAEEMYAMMCEAYENDLAAMSEAETATSSLFELMSDYDSYNVGIKTGESADYI